MKQCTLILVQACLFALVADCGIAIAAATPPNVVLVMTDDQGDALLTTPAVSRLASESVRLTNYHVDPTCSPTRAALMTGRYSSRTGVWHTVMGRSILRKDETTMAQVFERVGYKTGIFGKWHLGDNYPYRPQDRGFHEVLVHGGGGVGQTPDIWGNDYFDDTYLHNGRPEKFTGYCTDIWFDAAFQFIRQNKDRPFFAYIATNAPHSPYRVDDQYRVTYVRQGMAKTKADFCGMIENIDENVDRLVALLKRLGLAENTILIFTTDNGQPPGMNVRDDQLVTLRGAKGSEYEGGHRVPFYLRWPSGNLTGGRDVDALTAHIDVLPTLIDLCGLTAPQGVQFDGISLVPLLNGKQTTFDRTLFVHSQRVEHPVKWKQSAVLTDRWSLIDGKELYDIAADPGQMLDIAADHGDVVAELRSKYDGWWSNISTRFDEYVRIELGSLAANPVSLTCHDWHAPTNEIPWDQRMVSDGLKGNGFWAVEVLRDGHYEFTLRDRPAGVPHRLTAKTARIKIGDVEQEQKVAEGPESITFTVSLKKGPASLQTWLDDADGKSHGAYFVNVKFID